MLLGSMVLDPQSRTGLSAKECYKQAQVLFAAEYPNHIPTTEERASTIKDEDSQTLVPNVRGFRRLGGTVLLEGDGVGAERSDCKAKCSQARCLVWNYEQPIADTERSKIRDRYALVETVPLGSICCSQAGPST